MRRDKLAVESDGFPEGVDRAIVLSGGKVIADGTVKEVMQVDDPWLQSYFRVRTMLEGPNNNRGT